MACRWLKLIIAYDGTNYAGWQVQPDRPTIQAAVEKAWRQITQEEVRITAAGRTDAGVHALGQVAGLATKTQLASDALLRALNAVLPGDVSVVSIKPAPCGFHATRDAVGKTYRYQIDNGRVPCVFDRPYAWHFPQPLNAAAMHAAAQVLVGRHDFSSFETAGSERPDSIRTIHKLTVARDALPMNPRVGEKNRITIEVSGDGFLYNMVRTMVGTLVEIGKGARDIGWLVQVLAARDRRQAGQTAPPNGLFLVHVDYGSYDTNHRVAYE
jgi:tRNA pseudouridine38-40 synthase